MNQRPEQNFSIVKIGRKIVIVVLILNCGAIAFADDKLAQQILDARTPHEALGISSSASKDEIERAYRTRMKVFFLAANQGEKRAVDVLAKLNDTRDYFNDKPSNWARASRASGPQGPTSGFGSGGGRSQVWTDFYTNISLAKSEAEKFDLRTQQMRHVKSLKDFEDVVTMGLNPLKDMERVGAGLFMGTQMDRLMELNPDLASFNKIVRNADPSQYHEMYAGGFRAAKRPDQFIALMMPNFMGSNGGSGWIKAFERAAQSELYRFFLLNPSPQQIEKVVAITQIGFGQNGGAILDSALRMAAYHKKNGSLDGYRSSLMASVGEKAKCIIRGLAAMALGGRW